MKPILRSWCLFILAVSLLLTPQITLVHALSHTLGHTSNEQHASDKVCDSCLALAQLGAALPTQFHWNLPSFATPESVVRPAQLTELERPWAYRARAPPIALS